MFLGKVSERSPQAVAFPKACLDPRDASEWANDPTVDLIAIFLKIAINPWMRSENADDLTPCGQPPRQGLHIPSRSMRRIKGGPSIYTHAYVKLKSPHRVAPRMVSTEIKSRDYH
jgi:hypothetical protein